jgi:hypothetical protein
LVDAFTSVSLWLSVSVYVTLPHTNSLTLLCVCLSVVFFPCSLSLVQSLSLTPTFAGGAECGIESQVGLIIVALR